MARVIITMKIMPESPDSALEPIKEKARHFIKEFGGEDQDIRFSEEPVAFGLIAIKAMFVMDESIGSTEDLEAQITGIKGVSSVQITDVRRAVG